MNTLIEIAYKDAIRLQALEEVDKESFDGTAHSIARMKSNFNTIRTSGLRNVGRHLRAMKDSHEAISWLNGQDRRFSLWCACKVLHLVFPLVETTAEQPRKLVCAVERWIDGSGCANDITDILRDFSGVKEIFANARDRYSHEKDPIEHRNATAAWRAARAFSEILYPPLAVLNAVVTLATIENLPSHPRDPDNEIGAFEEIKKEVSKRLLSTIADAAQTVPLHRLDLI